MPAKPEPFSVWRAVLATAAGVGIMAALIWRDL